MTIEYCKVVLKIQKRENDGLVVNGRQWPVQRTRHGLGKLFRIEMQQRTCGTMSALLKWNNRVAT